MYLRYGWTPPKLPEKCGCGETFTTTHAMQCMVGGFRGYLHNEVNYIYYDACKQAGFHDVCLEPKLQPLDGEVFKYKSANKDDEARSDLRVMGFWSRSRRAFFDVTAFSPFARSHQGKTPSALFQMHEQRKIREYRERILNVEHGDFNPLVFSTTGGMGYQATRVLKEIAKPLAEKQNLPFSVVMGRLRCRLSFSILRSSLILLRGSRPKKPKKQVAEEPEEPEAIDLAVSEAHIELW